MRKISQIALYYPKLSGLLIFVVWGGVRYSKFQHSKLKKTYSNRSENLCWCFKIPGKNSMTCECHNAMPKDTGNFGLVLITIVSSKYLQEMTHLQPPWTKILPFKGHGPLTNLLYWFE